MSEQREMTLYEWVNRLPDFHLANKQYQQLQQRNAELAATVERLRIAALNAISIMPSGQAKADLRDAYDATPEQNLNAVRREAIEEAVKGVGAVSYNPPDDPHCCAVAHNDALTSILNFANQRYPVKDGE